MTFFRTPLQIPRRRALIMTAALTAVVAGAFACSSGDPATTETVATSAPVATKVIDGTALSAAANRDLAALRAATASLHRFEQAAPAGYDEQFPPGCFKDATGAMGFHYINKGNVGTLEAARPQLVLYEPQADGSRKLVGVEYIVPGDPKDPAPVLFDQSFTYNTTFKVWALHAWVWENNPLGIFASWNPRVSCQYADVVAAGSHH